MKKFDFSSGDVLLSIDDVCARLSISRSTLERLRRTGDVVPSNDDFVGAPVFPEPTLVIGRSPRWSATALNEWLSAASSPSKSLGAREQIKEQIQAFSRRERFGWR